MKYLILACCISLMCASTSTALRTSVDYSVPFDGVDAAGAPAQSSDYLFEGGAVGEFGAGSTIASSSYMNKAGFAAQQYYVVGLSVTAPSNTLNEGSSIRLVAAPLLDDGTTLPPLDATNITWSIVSGPLASISSSGLATASIVYQDSGAIVRGVQQDFSATLALTVLNVSNDDYGAYANDGIADSWQILYFGENNPAAGPAMDPDGDGATNLAEYQAGTNPTFPDVRLLNISTRLRVLAGDNVLIGGFIITGNDPKKVMVRGIGPSLSGFGVQGALADPTLELHAGDGSLIAGNDNWREASNAADISATGIAPRNDLESAIMATLLPGSYTVILRGKDDGIGIGLVEAYDLDQSVASKLANISTRGFVDTGDNVMIGGFIINGTGTGSPTVVIRAIGPSLANFGVQGPLQDPTLELHDANGGVFTNNDWQSDPNAAQIPASLQPKDPRESATYQTLVPGAYTVIVRGVNNATGIALVEVYALN